MKLRIRPNASHATPRDDQAAASAVGQVVAQLFASALLFPAAAGSPVHAEQARAFHASPGTTLSETSGHVVRDINERGMITISATVSAKSRGFVLGDRGLEAVPGLKRYDFSSAFGINNRGDVVGSANGLNGQRAFYIKADATLVTLQLLTGDVNSGAFAVNDSGTSVGYSSGGNGIRAVQWTAEGQAAPLAFVPDATSTQALGINAGRVVVGVASTSSGSRAVQWVDGTATILPALPGHAISEALAINDRGIIVGSSGNPQISRRAVLWTPELHVEDLGSLPGGRSGRALGINERDEIVGTAESATGNHAFYWSRFSGMQDLNDIVSLPAGLVLTQASSINSQGSIVAIGYFDNHAAGASGDPGSKAGADNHELPLQIVRINPVN